MKIPEEVTCNGPLALIVAINQLIEESPTPGERNFLRGFKEIAEGYYDDSEAAHEKADELLLEWLTITGGTRLANAFLACRGQIGFWYS